MALFSLLVAILVERLKVLSPTLQLDRLLDKYHGSLFGDTQLKSPLMMIIALVFPAVVISVLGWVISGLFWGLLSLSLWVLVAVLCFNHQHQRQAFKRYVQAACRNDAQACYHYAQELEPCQNFDAISGADLGCKVGQSVAWTNYRYYGAVTIFFIVFGPVGSVLYCTVRYYAEINTRDEKNWPLVEKLLFILDWLPSRIFSFGYVLCGEFKRAIDVWRQLAIHPFISAREIIVQTAMAAEPLACPTTENISLDPTIAMLALSKRNFSLIVAALSLLTIFGMVS